MSRLVDASTVLAVILGEKGSSEAALLLHGAQISTVNHSEVLRKLVDVGMEIGLAQIEFARFEITQVDFDEVQSIEAARLRPLTSHLGMSFADRACLALASLRKIPVYTADRKWAEFDTDIDIRLIR